MGATLTSMYNRAHQTNLQYVPATDDDADRELASKQPPITTHTDIFQTDPDEELSKEIMFTDEGKSVPDPHFMASIHFQSKPSTSKSAFDFRSSSLSTPHGGFNSNLHEDDFATKPGPSTILHHVKLSRNTQILTLNPLLVITLILLPSSKFKVMCRTL